MEINNTSIDELAAADLNNAQNLLKQGCSDLLLSTGLSFEPDFLAHALRVPELAADVCAGIERACFALRDPDQMVLAKKAVDAIVLSAQSMRIAVGRIAAVQGASNKAISAYNDNL